MLKHAASEDPKKMSLKSEMFLSWILVKVVFFLLPPMNTRTEKSNL